jgi:DNA-binding protein YbaB
MADLAVVEKQRAALSATADAANGTVTVTVNAHGVVSETVVDESYLDGYELADLGRHVTAAAQAAARDVAQRSAQLLAPLAARRARFPSLSDVVEGAPDIRDLLPGAKSVVETRQFAEDPGHYPDVRSSR